MPIIRRSYCVPLHIVVCPVVAVVMLESWVARCVHCVENVAWLPVVAVVMLESRVARCVHCVENVAWLQHHNGYNRTDNCRQQNTVGSPDDGHKDTRNMLRYYWLPINHYLLHLVGLTFTYFILYIYFKILCHIFAKTCNPIPAKLAMPWFIYNLTDCLRVAVYFSHKR